MAGPQVLDPGRRDRLHLNVRVPSEHGPEAQLLQAGAGLDVIGLRHWELTPETVAAVVQRYPRHDMKRASHPVFKRRAIPAPERAC